MAFVHIEEPPRPSSRVQGFALWQLGFRPFYLLASAFAALSIAGWAAQYAGWLAHPYLAGPVWHAHEMVFGFALAVIVGFLFTAGRNWAGQPTPTGRSLAALALLWIAARVLVLTPWGWAAAAANVAFPLACAAGLARALVAGGNRRNYFFVGLLAAMGIASLGVHLAQLGVIALPARLGLDVALDLVLFIMAVMGGRVIPMFTNNGVRGAAARRHPMVERAALGSVLALAAADLAQVGGAALAGLLAFAAVAHVSRLALWTPLRTLRVPLVWVLHAAYAWIPVHLALRAMGEMGWVSPVLATHALTVGAIGALTLGMMTRTARGHTGRALVADRWEVACYALVLGAAAVRVLVPLVAPSAYTASVLVSAAAWSAAWSLYAVRYWPVLTRARLDGRPG